MVIRSQPGRSLYCTLVDARPSSVIDQSPSPRVFRTGLHVEEDGKQLFPRCRGRALKT